MQNVGRMNVLQATEDLYQVTVFVQCSLAVGVGKECGNKENKEFEKSFKAK